MTEDKTQATELVASGMKPGIMIKTVGCYATNIGEMADHFYETLINPETEGLKDLDVKVVVATIQAQYDQFRESIFECSGKEFEIELPDNTTGLLIGLLLQTLNLRLDKPVVADSKTV